ncbi:MAG TPA: hypothetical protein PKD70_07430 [Saprospiraceae bacterium]|nr:hypothetical protein [Saprospiraceae bacterium]HMP13694.1 hypothetical protein [Saprospiraceae bacterium]
MHLFDSPTALKALTKRKLSSISNISDATAATLVPLTELLVCSDQHFLERTGETIHYEYVIVAGVVRAFVYPPKGEDNGRAMRLNWL